MEHRPGVLHAIRLFTNLVRDESMIIGIILYEERGENPRVAVRMTQDWSWVELLAPQIDIGLLRNMEGELARELTSRSDIGAAISNLSEQLSNAFQIADGVKVTKSAIVLADFDAEVDRLMELYVNRPPLCPHPGPPKHSSN